jgi:hypothetical protein
LSEALPAHIQPVKLPAGPIKVLWQPGQQKGGAWIVQLPKVPGYSYFVFRGDHDSKSGMGALWRAIMSAAEMAKYKKRTLWIGAPELIVKQAMGKDIKALWELTGVRYSSGK